MSKKSKLTESEKKTLKQKAESFQIEGNDYYLNQIGLASKELKGMFSKEELASGKESKAIQASFKIMEPRVKRFHGARPLASLFAANALNSPCVDRFGYMIGQGARKRSKLELNDENRALLSDLGNLMGNSGRESLADPNSTIPAGFTYFGQFVDHDLTLDVSSSLDTTAELDATTILNMRTPSFELDSVYSDGPFLRPYLYEFPNTGPSSAIKFRLGSNRPSGPGGPSLDISSVGMRAQTRFDVPRMINFVDPTNSAFTAVIGDPRNDENLIISQIHFSVLTVHNAVVDSLVLSSFLGDIFGKAKELVIHHYQWAVFNDYLKRICGEPAVSEALGKAVSIGSGFRMPVEFSVAAYRFGHSLVRENYWVNHNFPNASMLEVFQFIRKPLLPVLSSWVVNMNSFFETGVPVPVFNFTRKIDTILTNALESLPGTAGIMSVLAARNLNRGLIFGLPSGQVACRRLGITPMTTEQLTTGIPVDEVEILNRFSGRLLEKTPIWYYILREASVLGSGNSLGPLGARIVARTFARILKRDANSFINNGFTPSLPSAVAGNFTVADLMNFAGVTRP